MNNFNSTLKKTSFSIALLVLLCSCGTDRRLYSYFRDVPDSTANITIADTGYKPLLIKPDDLVQINISSPNAEANAYFMTPGATINNPVGGSSVTPNIYLIDKDGGIDMPLIGRVKIDGLSTMQAREQIRLKLLAYLKEPIVTVRFQNFKVTVLGEVAKPGTYIISNERISILDALGMAGDLTIFGKRENVMLIREKNGQKIISRLNLNNSQLFLSPDYYLQQNDLVYIEPNKTKIVNSDRTTVRNITIITSLISLTTVLLSRLIK